MAISTSDNIHALVNRPLDFKFGPFIDFNQANSFIPISQRYHGLIFGVYANPGNIATSDIKFYYYWNGLSDTDIRELGKPPVDGTYVDQAAMIAAQSTQLAKYIYYDNASYWEYLGTTNGNISDYRRISFTIAGPTTNGNVLTIVGGVPTWQAPVSTSKWTDIGPDIYRNSRVLVGATTFSDPTSKFEVEGNALITGTATINNTLSIRASATASAATQIPVFIVDPSSITQTIVTRTPAQLLNDLGGSSVNDNITGVSFTSSTLTLTRLSGNLTASVPTFNQNTTGSAATLTTTRTLWGQNFNGSANVTGSLTSVGDITGLGALTLTATSGTLALTATGANTITLNTNGVQRILIDSSGNVNINDSNNLIFGTTNGTKIGTTTSQKIGFFNATPIVQPSGDILTALSNLGLVSSPTISGSSITDAVLYTSQTKTNTERNITRTNIGSTSATPQIISTAGAINDLAITSNHLVFTGASVVLSGIVAGLDGEEITILNASGTNLELLSQSALSLAGNRFNSGIIVPNLGLIRLKYRTTTNRWIFEVVSAIDSRYLRKDIADSRSGTFTQNGSSIFNIVVNQFLRIYRSGGGSTPSFQIFDEQLSATIPRFEIGNTGNLISLSTQPSEFTTSIRQLSRSQASNRLVRRDELYLNYSETVTTTGTINNLSIDVSTKLLILTGCDDITGIVPVDDTRLLRIEARGANRIIRDQNTGSTAGNRFALGADLTINDGEVYQFIYTNARWRRVL